MFAASAASMALEIVAGRMLAPYVGMSLYSWTAIIAVVLAGLSLGHWLGGIAADRSARPARVAGLALLAAAATAALSVAVLPLVAPALARLDPMQGIGLLSVSAFLLPSLFAGVLSPLVTRLALDAARPGRQGRVLGRMFALGALGAIAGTVLAGFWMVSDLGSRASVLAVAGCYLVLAPPFLAAAGRVAALALAGLIGIGALLGPRLMPALASPCTAETAYYCIRIDHVRLNGRPATVLVLDHLAHGVNDPVPTVLPMAYLDLADRLVRRRMPDRPPEAFFVGGGALTLPRAWAAGWPGARITVAEIDPGVTAAAGRMGVDVSAFEILHSDARIALRDLPAGRRFDVILSDVFRDIAMPQHLVTDEFHALVAARLKPGGVYLVNVIEALWRPPFLLSLIRTLKARFPVVELWIDTAELSREERRVTWLVLASDRPTGTDRIDAAHPLPRTWLRLPAERMLTVLPADQTVFLTDDLAPVDRLMRHVMLDRRLAED